MTSKVEGKSRGGSANLTNAGKGRKKGVPNKTTAALKDMILKALDGAHPEGGVAYLVRQSDENPAAFMSLVGKVLPMTVAGTGEGGSHRIIVETGVPRD